MPESANGRDENDGMRGRPDLEFWRLCARGSVRNCVNSPACATISTVRELADVLRMDQRDRWPRGEHVPVESYLERFPKVRADADCSFELIYGEYLLREEWGDPPTSAEYVERFPEHAERLRLQIDLHLAIDEFE